MCLLCTKKTKQYPPCKLEQHTSISPTVVSIFLLYAVTFLLGEKYGSDKHSHSKGPFTRGKTESACNRSVSHGKREVDTGSLQTHQQGRGQGRRRFNSVQCVKISPLTWPWRKRQMTVLWYIHEDCPIGNSDSWADLGKNLPERDAFEGQPLDIPPVNHGFLWRNLVYMIAYHVLC